MNVPHFHYSAVSAGSRPAQEVPYPMKEIGQKRAAKLCRVPPVGCHAQSGLKCTGRRPSPPGWATTGCMVRQRSIRRKPLYLQAKPLNGGDGTEGNAARFGRTLYFHLKGASIRTRKQVTPFILLPRAARGRVCHLEHPLRSGIRNMGTACRLPALGNRLSVDDRGRTDAGRSLRSSPGTGKPSTWRREAGDRLSFEAGGYLWTQR